MFLSGVRLKNRIERNDDDFIYRSYTHVKLRGEIHAVYKSYCKNPFAEANLDGTAGMGVLVMFRKIY